MELRQLEHFIAIIDAGAFSRAALKLMVSQPILSRQIKALENEFGVTLYHRTGRGIVLTEAGKLLEKYAREILAKAGTAQREISALGSTPTGNVVIGMPPSVGAVFTVPVVQQFCADYPGVMLDVMEGLSAHVLDWLVAGRIDLAVLYNTPHVHSLMTDPLLTDELFLLGPASDPANLGNRTVATEQLERIPLILPSRPHGMRLLVEETMNKLGLVPNVRIEIDSMQSTMQLIEKGLGYTVHSYFCVHQLIEDRKIRCWRLTEPTITRSLVLATSTQRPTTEASRALSRIVREQTSLMSTQTCWVPRL